MALPSRGIVALFLLPAAPPPSAQAQPNWVLCAPKGPGFRVELPMQPKISSANIKPAIVD